MVDPQRPLPDLSLPINPERVAVVQWARQVIADGCLILDTETIDLPAPRGRGAEICEIALVQLTGQGVETRLAQHVRPSHEHWSADAINVHGITPATVRSSPPISEIWFRILQEASRFDHLIIYNSQFDIRALRDSLKPHGVRLACPESSSRTGCRVFPTGAGVHCAMLQLSAWTQEKKRGKPGWKWQKLPSYPECEAHSALGDCQSTAKLIRDLASVEI